MVIWQFPQSIVAVFLRLYFAARKINLQKQTFNNRTIFSWDGSPRFAVSLGEFIFTYRIEADTLSHEYGHCRQSRYLGPLYLISVGVVSVFWNLLARVNKNVANTYYQRWPENWADVLGGVERAKP
jgi:hypothetical protein